MTGKQSYHSTPLKEIIEKEYTVNQIVGKKIFNSINFPKKKIIK